MHEPGEFLSFARRDPIIVHDVKRIPGLPHVQPRQRAPGAADRVECTVLAVMQHVQFFERFLDELLRPLERFSGDVLERETAERQRHAAAHAGAMHIDKFERSAAEIADDTVGLVDSRNDPECRQMGLALARKNRDAGTANALGFGDECAAIACVAAGGGRNRPDTAHMQDIAQGTKTAEGIECGVDRIGRQQPGRLHLSS